MPSVEKGAIKISTANAMGTVLNKKMGVQTGFAPKDWPATINLCGKAPEKTVSGAIASFSDGADDVPVKSASFGIVASGGGGTPSTPVPIVGHSSVTVYHTDGQTPPVESEQVTIQLGQTVYGGTLAEDGTLTITHKISTIDENSGVIKANAENCFYLNDFFDVEDTNDTCVCNVYTKANNRASISTVQSNNPDFSFCRITSNYTKRLAIKDSRYSTIEDYNTWLSQNPVQIVQELATPIVITGLDEISLSTYLGNNSIWCDTGNSEVTYRADAELILGE